MSDENGKVCCSCGHNIRTGEASDIKCHCDIDGQSNILNAIDKQQTVYDVDKVVEQLEDYLFDKYCVEGDSKIYEIVRGGGTQ